MPQSQLRYRNPSEERSGNHGISPTPFNRIAQVRASTLPQHLRETLVALLRFNRFGTELWAATMSVAVEAGKCRRSIQIHLDRLIELKVLEEISPANTWVRYRGSLTFRHSATYRLNPDSLNPRLTYEEHRARRAAASRKVMPIRPETPKPPEPASPPPSRKLNDRTIRVLAKGINYYMAGNTKDEFGYKLQPNDHRYRAPLKREEAIRQTCKDEGIDVQAALESQLRAGHRDLRERGSPEGESR